MKIGPNRYKADKRTALDTVSAAYCGNNETTQKIPPTPESSPEPNDILSGRYRLFLKDTQDESVNCLTRAENSQEPITTVKRVNTVQKDEIMISDNLVASESDDQLPQIFSQPTSESPPVIFRKPAGKSVDTSDGSEDLIIGTPSYTIGTPPELNKTETKEPRTVEIKQIR